MLSVQELAIPEVKLLMPHLHRDNRGYVTEVMQERELTNLGLPRFVQENQSMTSGKNVVRGLHCQKAPHTQAKLVRVLQGKIFDVAVDARANSKTFGQHVSTILDSEDGIIMMYVPPGFLHGFCTLSDQAVVLYKMSDFYAPGSEIGARWDDPDLKINWPIKPGDAILSDKDNKLPLFRDFPRFDW